MSTPQRREVPKKEPVRLEPLKPGAGLDEQGEWLRKAREMLGDLVKIERIDPYQPLEKQHQCLQHGCPICMNWCNDNDSHGCQVCTTGPCGGSHCRRCWESWGTTDPAKVKVRSFGEVTNVNRNYLSRDVVWGLNLPNRLGGYR